MLEIIFNKSIKHNTLEVCKRYQANNNLQNLYNKLFDKNQNFSKHPPHE